MGRRTLVVIAGLAGLISTVNADLVRLVDGQKIEGIVLEENAQQVRICSDSGTMAVPRESIAAVERVPTSRPASAALLPPWKVVVAELAARRWATAIEQIPSTVIDEGVLRNVPYRSFRCGGDYELNIYGDPDEPAGIEIGVYRDLLQNPEAKRHCLDLIGTLLADSQQRDALMHLDTKGASAVVRELTLEITPPDSPDAYGGWWVSVYSMDRLEKARATAGELEAISEPFNVEVARTPASTPAPAATQVTAPGEPVTSGWTAAQLSKARPPAKTATKPRVYTSGFTRKSGSYSAVRHHSILRRSSIFRSRARRR